MAVTTPDIKPLTLKDIDLIVGELVAGVPTFTDGINYKKHVDQVELVPTAQTATWTGMGNNTHSDVSTASWAATVRYAQDWDTPGSFSEFLFDHEGEHVPVKFRPRTGSGSTFEAVLVISPGAVGGQVNQIGTPTSVTLGCESKPTRTPAA
jgi:hypothetical protein